MNPIRGVLEEGHGRALVRVARAPDGDLRLFAGPFLAANGQYAGAPVLLGIRCEALTKAGAGGDESAAFDTRIDVIVPTGADNLALVSVGDSDVIARLPPGRNAAGDRVRLQIDPERALIFDPASERLIR